MVPPASAAAWPGDMGAGEGVKEFLEACSTASFGIDGETVTDKALS